MTQINAYLKFNGNCRDAFEFYNDCLSGQVTMQTVGESPMAAQMPVEMHNHVLHAVLTAGGITLMGSDMRGGDDLSGSSIYLCLVCSTLEEIRTYYAKLVEGGQATHPLKEEFFGTFGDLTDKFGMNWMLQYAPMPPPAQG